METLQLLPPPLPPPRQFLYSDNFSAGPRGPWEHPGSLCLIIEGSGSSYPGLRWIVTLFCFFFWPVLFQVTAVESRSYDSGQHLVDASASSVVLLDPHTSHINYCLRLRSMILLFCSVHAASIACLSVLGEGSLLCGSFFPTIKSVFFLNMAGFPHCRNVTLSFGYINIIDLI